MAARGGCHRHHVSSRHVGGGGPIATRGAGGFDTTGPRERSIEVPGHPSIKELGEPRTKFVRVLDKVGRASPKSRPRQWRNSQIFRS